jgi:pimeloyl-ACP methyl ester carboxylesterase/ribosomal protein S18 acetylase RimI-like enzyme
MASVAPRQAERGECPAAPVVTIRALSVQEFDRLEPLWLALHDHHTGLSPRLAGMPARAAREAWGRRREAYRRWAGDPETFVLGAEIGDRLLGYAFVTVGSGYSSWNGGERQAQLETLSVAPESRGHGIGERLLAAVRERLAAKGIKRLALGALCANVRAHRFYERHGFHRTEILFAGSTATEVTTKGGLKMNAATRKSQFVTSADGTAIGFDRFGGGLPLIMAAGAFNTRSTTEPLAMALESDFTVLNYDRRGRGQSGDSPPYAVQREIEDLDALITEAGGRAAVFGYSSGATLALKAAARGLAISKLVLYDPSFVVDESMPPLPRDLPQQLAALVEADRRGDAVELFQTRVIGMPEAVVAQMRQAPFRPGMEALAHTLVYESILIGDLRVPSDLLSAVSSPTLVISGENSPPVLRAAAQEVADKLPQGRLVVLDGQSHDISPNETAAAVREFLAAECRST